MASAAAPFGARGNAAQHPGGHERRTHVCRCGFVRRPRHLFRRCGFGPRNRHSEYSGRNCRGVAVKKLRLKPLESLRSRHALWARRTRFRTSHGRRRRRHYALYAMASCLRGRRHVLRRRGRTDPCSPPRFAFRLGDACRFVRVRRHDGAGYRARLIRKQKKEVPFDKQAPKNQTQNAGKTPRHDRF